MASEVDDYTPRVKGLRRWRLHRRLKRAASLLARNKISDLDYATIAIGVISDLRQTNRLGQKFSLFTFKVEATFSLGFDIDALSDPRLDVYGPLGDAVGVLGEHFPVESGGGDIYHVKDLTFTWGLGAERALRRGHLRLRFLNRLAERIDAWRAEQAELTPHLHDDLWKAVIAIVATAFGFMLGRITAGGF